jgi:hypothetical protein
MPGQPSTVACPCGSTPYPSQGADGRWRYLCDMCNRTTRTYSRRDDAKRAWGPGARHREVKP